MKSSDRRRAAARRTAMLGLAALAASTLAAAPPIAQGAAIEGITLPAGFQDTVVIGGLNEPTAIAFAPDGTAFVGIKAGEIKAYDQVDGAYPVAGEFADLREQVHNYWDRGLVGITVDPGFPAKPYVYASYTYNRDPRDNPPVVPKWGEPGESYDACPEEAGSGAGGEAVGCLAMMRVSRLTAVRNAGDTAWQLASNGERVLVQDSCLQFPSHASGGTEFGPDGMLYASVGEGASFDFEDYGQVGYPDNCGDPYREGGSLRSQDVRTTSDPTGLGGVVIRIDPGNGNASTGAAGPGANAQRIAAYGLRNPWRLAFRPGTRDLWVGDVGGNNVEELNRIPAADTAQVNFGWPCYEGAGRNEGFDALDLSMCETLYTSTANGGSDRAVAPRFGYPTRENGSLPGAACQTGTSSVSGLAFVPPTSSYPASYRGSLVFTDYARRCLWMLGQQANGEPDPSQVRLIAQNVSTPVDLTVGPGGDLYYVDFGVSPDGVPTGGLGGVHRISYSSGNQPPEVSITADRRSGPAPLTVAFTANGTDADGDPLTYAWDLDGDGQYDDATGRTATRTYAEPVGVEVSVRASDGAASASSSITISPGNTAPVITTLTPDPALTWSVGDQIAFAATASDAQQPLPASAYQWSLSIAHCPAACHVHPTAQFPGVRSGALTAPDHEYPSHLVLSLKVTDSQGLSSTRTVEVHPKPVGLTFQASPAAIPITVAGASVVGPVTRTFIAGHRVTVSAPATQVLGGRTYTFAGWSDGGDVSHQIAAPGAATTYTARYTTPTPTPTPAPAPAPAPAPTPTAGPTVGPTVAPVPTVPTAALRLRTGPVRLKVRVDGSPRRSAWIAQYAVGSVVTVWAPRRQWRQGRLYEFRRWSDQGPRGHVVSMPAGGLRVKAVYRRVR